MEPDLPIIRAERAMLGAALTDPTQIKRVPWLLPLDFRQPHHAAAWAVMTTLGPDVDPRRMPMLVLEKLRRSDAAHAVDGVKLHTLMEACPNPAAAPYYGGIVAEGSARRLLDLRGQHLQHVASKADTHGIDATLAEAVATKERVDGLADRWHDVPEEIRARIDALAAPDGRKVELPAPPKPRPAHADRQAEEMVIGSVLADPAMWDRLSWLDPRDFGTPGHGAAWNALHHMRRAGAPLDAVTLDWQLQRAGLNVPPGELERMAREAVPVMAEHVAVVVGGAAALDRIDLAGRQLRTLADAHQVPPTDLLNTAQTVVQQLPMDVDRIGPRLPEAQQRIEHAEQTPARVVERSVDRAPARPAPWAAGGREHRATVPRPRGPQPTPTGRDAEPLVFAQPFREPAPEEPSL